MLKGQRRMPDCEHDWADLSPEEYVEMRLREAGVPEDSIQDIIKEFMESAQQVIKRDNR